MGKVVWNDSAPGGLGAVAPAGWFDSGCGAGPRVRWLPDGTLEIEGEGVPVKALPKDVAQWRATVAQAAAKHGVPPQLVTGVMATESGGNPKAHSFCCYGLMGLLPSTAATQAGRTVGAAELVADPTLNIDLGAKLLGSLFKKYAGNVVRIAAAYNAGSPKCGSGKCGAPNRWNLVADCVNGKAVDYSGRVIGFTNAAVKAGVASAGPVSAPGGTPWWQVALGAASLAVVGLAVFKPGMLAGALKSNPEQGPMLTQMRAVYHRPKLTGNWVIKEATAKRVVIYSPGSGEFGARFAGKKYTFTWDGTGYKRQGQYLYEEPAAKDNPRRHKHDAWEVTIYLPDGEKSWGPATFAAAQEVAERFRFQSKGLCPKGCDTSVHRVAGKPRYSLDADGNVVDVRKRGALRANPDENLIRRAASILQYASPEEAAEILVESEDLSAEEAYLAVRAGQLLLRDREGGK